MPGCGASCVPERKQNSRSAAKLARSLIRVNDFPGKFIGRVPASHESPPKMRAPWNPQGPALRPRIASACRETDRAVSCRVASSVFCPTRTLAATAGRMLALRPGALHSVRRLAEIAFAGRSRARHVEPDDVANRIGEAGHLVVDEPATSRARGIQDLNRTVRVNDYVLDDVP